MNLVVVLERLAPEVAIIAYGGDQALWASTKARKRSTCVISGDPIKPGDAIYRPVGNQQYRSARALASAVETAPLDGPRQP